MAQVEGSICLLGEQTNGSWIRTWVTESLNESVPGTHNRPISSISVTMQLKGARLPQHPNPDLFLTKCLVPLNRKHCEHIQSNYCRKKTPARRDWERLFLSGCLHYSCKKLHAGQWISRKLRLRSTMGAIETGAAIHQREDESCSSGMNGWAQERFREEETDGGTANTREIRGEKWASTPSRVGNDRTLISPYQYE